MKNGAVSSDAVVAAAQNIKERDYWLNKLSGNLEKSAFPYDYKGLPGDKGGIVSLSFKLSDEISAKLMKISNRSDPRLHIVLAAGLFLLLHRYTGGSDIIVGTPIYTQEVEGKPINTVLALRNQVRPDMPFKEFLLQVARSVFEANENQNFPLHVILPQLNIPGHTPEAHQLYFPLFDVALLLTNIQAENDIRHIKLNMVFSFARTDQGLEGLVEYNASLYKKTTIERLIGHFCNLMDKVVSNVDLPVSTVDILTADEKNRLLYHFNDTAAGYPAGKTLQRLFEVQVEKTPDHIAAAQNHQMNITYRELNQKSNQLAHLLRKKGVQPDTIAGIMLERSIEAIIGILAILKASGAYLPLETDYPADRIRYMVGDSQTPVLLTQTQPLAAQSFTALQGSQPVKAIPHVTGNRSPVTDIVGLPIPDRSLVNYEKYNQYIGQALVKYSIALQATRGCPYNCAYCHKIWPKKHITRSAENIFEEVTLYYNMGIRRFVFIDDIFNLNIKNSARFFELIIENRLQVQLFFPNGLRGDILTREYIDLMVKAGTVELALALETASPRLQKMIGKQLNLQKLEENIEYFCQEYPQVILELFIMHGFPSETREEADLTLNFVKKFKWLHFPYFHILKIYSNTDMEKLALENGISRKAIVQCQDLAYHELPETLPFEKSFTLKYQADFFNNYFMSKERLLHVLPYQMKLLTEDEILQKYNSYLPVEFDCFDDLLKFMDISQQELGTSPKTLFPAESTFTPVDLNEKIKTHFPVKEPADNALKVLLLDLSQFFSSESHILYDVVEPPLGLMSIMTHLNRQLGARVCGKIAKSRIDFDCFAELKQLLDHFQPEIIGIRTLTYYKDFFHKTVVMIRNWGYEVPIIAGGPYATSDYTTVLQDSHVDLVVLGEGEITFCELTERIIENNGQLPGEEVLKEVQGIAFVPDRVDSPPLPYREILVIDALEEELSRQPTRNPEPLNQPLDTAYVIYTSGTTGKPKGVLIDHRNVVRLLFNDQFQFDFDARDVWTMFHSYCFDFSVWEMYGALLKGGKLIVIPKMVARDPGTFLQVLNEEAVTVLNQTPSAFYGLIEEELNRGSGQLHLRYVIFGGEALKPIKLNEWKERYPGVKLVNMFGITETTVHVTYKEIGEKEIRSNISNIGVPIPTLSTYIMDRELNLVPPGAPGEACVGGAGVARGYLNRPGLTAEKFVHSPYKTGEKLYRSGDCVKLLENGEMEYLGRIDHQVKIRGFRVEPGEIENKLLNHPDIREVVAITKGDAGETYLCAYFVSDREFELAELRSHLSRDLPHYMIPAYFVKLERLPLTVNGKIDRKALPEPRGIDLGSQGDYEPPSNDLEKKLASIWEQVLGRERIGISDNFFEIGGDSIKSIQIAARLNQEGYKVKVIDIFQNPTISDLVPFLVKSDRIPDQSLISGEVPLTPIQEWFFSTIFTDRHHFNQAVMLYSRESFEEEAIRAVFLKILEHHDALRMTYTHRNGREEQVNHGTDYPFSLQVFDYRNSSNAISTMEARANEIQAGINLETGPLMKLGLFHLEDGHRLLIVIHHLVIDGVSWRILFEDIETLYRQYKKGEPLQLPLKSDSFRLWAEQLSQYAKSELIFKENSYWQEMESKQVPVIKKDFEQESNLVKDSITCSFTLSEEKTAVLVSKVNEPFATEFNDILLTALGLGIKKSWGNQRVLIALEGHGRGEILDVDISRTIGWFTSLYPVILDFSHGNDLSRQVKEVKESLRQVPNRGIGYGILNYLTPGESKPGLKFKRKPQMSFNYLGQFDTDVKEKSFGIAKESPGNSRSIEGERDYEIEITGMIANNRLTISVSYNKKQFKPETIDTFINHYKRELIDLISFCARQEKRQLTPGDLTYKGLSINELDRLTRRYPIMDIWPLSPMQEGVYFITSAGVSIYANFEQLAYSLQGNLDISYVEKSLNEISGRYDILRTAFVHEQVDRPLQLVLKERKIEFYYKDLRQIGNKEEKADFIKRFKEQDKERSFDLGQDVLIRVSILREDDANYIFIWSFHHILIDGWSLGILISDFFDIYNAHLEGRAYRLPKVKQFRDYLEWMVRQDKESSRNYWKNYLDKYEKAAVIPARKPQIDKNAGYTRQRIYLPLGKEKSDALRNLAVNNHVTLSTIFQAIWGILLGKYNSKRNTDVIFGIIVSGRPTELEGVESMVGLFINTVPLRVCFKEDTTLTQLLHQIQRDVINMNLHQYLPLAEIQSLSPLKQNLIDQAMVFETYPISEGIQKSNKRGIKTAVTGGEVFEEVNYDFFQMIFPGEQVTVGIGYNSSVYNEDYIKKIPAHIIEVVDKIIENPNVKIKNIKISQGLLFASSSILEEETADFRL
jgi:amino acid adenylation domain-containing protein/non-ribosomal peptide synthase protein (TIGR01720 family)